MTDEQADAQRGPLSPGPLHARLMMSFTLLPSVTTLCCVGTALVMRFAWRSFWTPGPWYAHPLLVLMAISPAVLTFVAWTLIWRSTVPWTRARRVRAAGVTAGFTVLVGGLAAICLLLRADLLLLILTCAGLLVIGVASILLARAWLSGLHTVAGLPCPCCDYDLRGQHECRCPECGEEYTVGQLVRSRRHFDQQGLLIH